MAELNLNFYSDPTLEAMNKQLEYEQTLERPRNYLGASEIGDECWRKLFYSFRGAAKRIISVSGIKAIQDGYQQEETTIKRLRAIKGIDLHNDDGEGHQIGFELLLGHFRGHVDGIVQGLLQSKVWHIFEHKAMNEKRFNELKKLIQEKGEKEALRNFDSKYYVQAQIYMHAFQLERHYLVASTPGGRDHISCRTEYNRAVAEGIIAKAQSIIFDNWNIPARLSDKREFYLCKFCEHQGICHDGDFPLVHCKTCRYMEPIKDGKRQCLKHEKEITEDVLFKGCDYHIYNPALISAKLVEHQEDGCIYATDKGFRFANIYNTGLPELKGELDAIYPSKHLFEKIKSVNNMTRDIVKIQQTFQGEIVDTANVSVKKAWAKNKELRDI
jgi:hypothetical protein